MTETQATAPRARNARGEGGRLRGEIVDAATTLLQQGSAEQLTLRAVARAAGISAPSIYRHFPDLAAIIRAVVDQAFEELVQVLRTGSRGTDPVERLHALAQVYLEFAQQHPQRYRLMFGGAWNAAEAPGADPEEVASRPRIGLEALQVIVDAVQECADAGASRSTDAFASATALWVGLHGLAGLRQTTPLFPWPGGVDRQLVDRLARLELAG
jgi:AcrR family transcriptional regulator